MNFRAEDYGAEIARVLDAEGAGHRPMPLVKTGKGPGNIAAEIARLATGATVASGLYLYCGCWHKAHETADCMENPDAYFWHAIVHRQEPDAGNAGYWFRKTGKHPVFPALAKEADLTGYRTGGDWDPFAFVEFCESACRRPGSKEEQVAIQIQLAEWQLLFDHCARGRNC